MEFEERRLIQVNGVFEIPQNMTHDDFLERLYKWCDENDVLFGGGSVEIEEDDD